MYNQQKEINKKTLINDERFISDALRFLKSRNGNDITKYTSKEKIYDDFVEHFRFQNVNEVTAINDMIYAQNATQEEKDSFRRLMDSYDKMDSDFGGKAALDYVQGVFTAPSTYAGIFTGGGAKVGALAAQQGVKLGIRQLLKQGAGGKALRSAATKGAARAGLVEGAIGAGQVAAQEQVRVETGLKDKINYGSVALGGALSAAPGAVLGSASQVQSALVSNFAEEMNQLATKTASEAILKANAKETKEAIKSVKYGETTRILYGKLKDRLELKETIPTELLVGREILDEFGEKLGATTSKDFAVKLELKKAQNIAAAGARLLESIPPLDKGEALTSRLARALNANAINVDSLEALAKRHGISISDIGSLLAIEVSEAASLMGTISGIKRAEAKKLLETFNQIDSKLVTAADTLTGKARKELDKKLGVGTLGKVHTVMQNINKARIGAMTVQLATTTRNTTNGYMRNIIYAFDNLGAGLYNKYFEAGKIGKNLAERKKLGLIDITDEEIAAEVKRTINLGKAQIKTFRDSIMFKDLMFGMTSADTAALKALMENPVFGKSEAAQRLFMQMGDVGQHIGDESSRVIKLARMANTLNTMSDNMFKRAIFAREIDKALRVGGLVKGADGKFIKYQDGFEGGLNEFLKTGRFGEMDEKMVGAAMENALDFTYQTGKFRGKEGIFNKAADTFIAASQTQLGSTFVPFPRYLVNQFRFVYEHTPILGMFNIGGILNKSGNVATDTADRFGKQIGGFVAIGGLYTMRELHGDDTTGPFEYYNPFGRGTVNAEAALGPFSTHALLADYIYQHINYGPKNLPYQTARYPEKKFKFSQRDFVKSLGGGQFRPTGLNLVDGFFDTMGAALNDGKIGIQLDEAAARYIGNYFNTYTVGAGMLKDVVATLDPEYRTVTDSKDVEFFPYLFKSATRSFPTNEEGMYLGLPPLPFVGKVGVEGVGPKRAKLESVTRTGGMKIMNPFMRQLTGLTQQEERNAAEKELDRLGFEFFQIVPKKLFGDPNLNNEMRGRMGQYVEGALQNYILTDEVYNGLPSDIEKRFLLKQKINELRSKARKEMLNPNRYVTTEFKSRIARVKYFDLSKDKRNLINLYYKREVGKDLSQTEDYAAALAIKEKYNF